MAKLNKVYYYIDGVYIEKWYPSPPTWQLFETEDEANDVMLSEKYERIAELERELKKLKEELNLK
jgi:hypothetical protein